MEVIIMKCKRFFTSRNIAFLAVLVALIIVLQLWGGNVRIAAHLFPLCSSRS